MMPLVFKWLNLFYPSTIVHGKDVQLADVVAAMKHPVSGIKLKDKRYFLKAYAKCFTGENYILSILFMRYLFDSRSRCSKLVIRAFTCKQKRCRKIWSNIAYKTLYPPHMLQTSLRRQVHIF